MFSMYVKLTDNVINEKVRAFI